MFSKQKKFATLLSLALVFLTLWIQQSDTPIIQEIRQRLEYITYDIRMNATLPDLDSRNLKVSIIDIDEKSLQTIGHWPWSRDVIARLVDKLTELGVVVIAFDMVFAEPDTNNAATVADRISKNPDENPIVLKRLKALIPEFNHDRKLAGSLIDRDTILGFVFHDHASPPIGILPTPLVIKNRDETYIQSIAKAPNFSANLPELQEAAGYGGFISTSPDADGAIRKTSLILRNDNNVYSSLALEAARLYLLIDEIGLTTELIDKEERLEYIHLGKFNIPTDSSGNVLIPYYGPMGTFPYISAADVLNDKADTSLLENRIVLIGTSAEGLFDLRATPVDGEFAGVEIHANIITGILNNQFPYEPPWAVGANFMLILITGLLLSLLLPHLSAVWMLFVSITITAAMIAFNFWIWETQGLVLALTVPLLMIIGTAILNLAFGFLVETTERLQLKNHFGQYVPPELVEEMNRNPEDYQTSGESREMTVLFADIRNFTSISETLTATELKDMLNRFFTPMTRIIFNHRGTIDKYVGDMVMAFWGAPVTDSKHANNAVEAALEMLKEVEIIKPDFKKSGLPEINIGIGLNTGIMNVGDMGSEYRRAYTVLGDSVNLASRLEGLTKYYGAGLVVSEFTKSNADYFIYKTLDLVRVKGKQQAIYVYEPVCKKEEISDELAQKLELHEQAFKAYMEQDWDNAASLYTQLHQAHPSTSLYKLYIDRIENLRKCNLGQDWDGVFESRTK